MPSEKEEIIRQLNTAGEQWVRDHRNNLNVAWTTVIDEWLAECEAERMRLQQADAQRKRELDADTLNERREANSIAREAMRTSRLAKYMSLLATFLSILATTISLYPKIVEIVTQLR